MLYSCAYMATVDVKGLSHVHWGESLSSLSDKCQWHSWMSWTRTQLGDGDSSFDVAIPRSVWLHSADCFG